MTSGLTAVDLAMINGMELCKPSHWETLNAHVLMPALKKMQRFSWKGWAFNNGNPFMAKITKANAAKLGVPTYFSVIRTPMDLVRMEERLTAKVLAEEGEPKCYKSVAEFVADVHLIAENAKTFNCPPQQIPVYQATKRFPHPSTLPPDQVPPGSVYAMAFDLEDQINAMAPHLQAEWDAHLFVIKRGIYDEVRALNRQQQAAMGGAGSAGGAY